MDRVTVITPASGEPLTLQEVKDYLRVSQNADDAVISGMISSARRYAEQWLGRVFLTQTLECACRGWPGGSNPGFFNRDIRAAGEGWGNWLPGPSCDEVEIPRPPLQSVVSVQYLDQSGAWQAITGYQVSKSEPAKIGPPLNTSWPVPNSQALEGVRIQFVAGYGDASALPPTIKAALLMWVAFLYENRGEESAEPPAAIASMLYTEDYGRI